MKKPPIEYTVVTNGMPDYTRIPKGKLQPLAKKFLENILKELQEKKTEA